MRGTRIAAIAFLFAALPARADSLSPFLPPADSGPKLVRLLAPADAIARETIEAFQRETGLVVALDAYGHGAEPATTGYDVVVLRGPSLARAIAAGTLARLDRARLANARLIVPAFAAKLGAYDKDGAYAVGFGWSAFGLLYDTGKTPAPQSFAEAIGAALKTRNCGAVWPDAREESFIAALRLNGVDPARAKLADVKSAGAALERARAGLLAFAAPDVVGMLAKGAACLGGGTEGEAAAARVRGGDSPADIRFAYPREGAPLALYAYALPRDARSPDAAYRLIEALLAPDAEAKNADAAGLHNAEAPAGVEELKRLAPEPVFDPVLTSAIQAEWKRLTAAK